MLEGVIGWKLELTVVKAFAEILILEIITDGDSTT
jgi:hypothetical protein